MMDKQEQIIDGFAFFNQQDADLARQEHLKISYLESHMDMEGAPPEDVLTIYKRAIQEKLFKTPVGISYLKHLNSYLLMQHEIETDRIPPIPLYLHYSTLENELWHRAGANNTPEATEKQPQPVQSSEADPNETDGDSYWEQTKAPEGTKSSIQATGSFVTKLKRAYLLPVMITVNALLVLLVILMFVIAINSNQPNILNYERILQNRYASWDQDLTQREQTIRDKERELGIE
jgi:hypothetical protein